MTSKDKFNSFTEAAQNHFPEVESINESKNHYIIKLFFDEIEDDDIESGFFGLGSNDGGVDFYYHDDENKIFYLCQIKTTDSYKCNLQLQEKDLDYLKCFMDKINERKWLSTKSSAVKEIANQLKNFDGKIEKKFFIMGDASEGKYSVASRHKIEIYNWNDIYKKHNELSQKQFEEQYIDDNNQCIIKSANNIAF